MENNTLLLKLKQRLNKLDSQDFDNIECWQFLEAFNKAQVEWCRRNLHGGNMYKEGDELSTISTMRNIFAKAKVSDSFTNQFGIYDLNEFLSAVSGFSKPELTLKDKYLTISSEGSKSKVKYYYCLLYTSDAADE